MKKLGIILLLSGVCLSLLVSCEDENKKKNNNLLLLIGEGPGTAGKALEAPSMVDATDGDYTDAIGLNWKPVPDAAGYAVYRSESQDGPFDKIGSVDAAAYATGMQAGGGTTTPPVTPPVTPPEPTPTEAVFQSDINLSGLMFNIGVYVLAWQTPKIKITIGSSIEGVAEFPGGIFGKLYSQSDVVAKINDVAGKTICYPVDAAGKKYVKIVSTGDAIVISNANTTLSYIPLKLFLKSDATKSTVITVKPEPVDTGGGDTGGGDTGGGTTIPAVTYNYVDKSVTQGKHYYYSITSVDADGLESEFSVIDDGFAVSSDAPARVQNVKASDGVSATKVTVTWDAVPGATYYRVYRSNGKATVQVGGDITGTSCDDAAPAGLLSYKVAAYNAFAESPYSSPDAGYRTVTNEEFYVEFARSMDYSLNRLAIMKKSGTGRLGKETISAQNSSGTCTYNAAMDGLSGAIVTISFVDFCDLYMTFNGQQKTLANLSENGTLKDSSVNVTGIYTGTVRYDIVISGGAPGGGNYYVSQGGGAETAIPWNYPYK